MPLNKYIYAKVRVFLSKYRSIGIKFLFVLFLLGWITSLAVHYFNLAPVSLPFTWFGQKFVTWQESCFAFIGAVFAYLAYRDASLSLHFLRGGFGMFNQLVEKMCSQLPTAFREIILLIGVPAWGYGTSPKLYLKFWHALELRLDDLEQGYFNLKISIVIVSPNILASYMWNLSQLRAMEDKTTNAKNFFNSWIEITEMVLNHFKRVCMTNSDNLNIYVRDDLSFRGCIVDEHWTVLAPIEASPADCGTDLNNCKQYLGSVVNFPARGFETKDRVITHALYNVLNEFRRTGECLRTSDQIKDYIDKFKAQTNMILNNNLKDSANETHT